MNGLAASVALSLLLMATAYLGVMQYATDLPVTFIFTGETK